MRKLPKLIPDVERIALALYRYPDDIAYLIYEYFCDDILESAAFFEYVEECRAERAQTVNKEAKR